jgi:hypothetical protein
VHGFGGGDYRRRHIRKDGHASRHGRAELTGRVEQAVVGAAVQRKGVADFSVDPAIQIKDAPHRNIYVRSEQAGQRVMESITRFITHKLKLKVNESKSAVARPQERKFLGFSFTAGPEVKRVLNTAS